MPKPITSTAYESMHISFARQNTVVNIYIHIHIHMYEIGGNIFYIEILDSTLTLFVRTLIFEGF